MTDLSWAINSVMILKALWRNNRWYWSRKKSNTFIYEGNNQIHHWDWLIVEASDITKAHSRPTEPKSGVRYQYFGPKKLAILKSRGKNPKVWFSTYFAILNIMVGLKLSKNYCGSHYKNCQVWLSSTVVLAHMTKTLTKKCVRWRVNLWCGKVCHQPHNFIWHVNVLRTWTPSSLPFTQIWFFFLLPPLIFKELLPHLLPLHGDHLHSLHKRDDYNPIWGQASHHTAIASFP